MQAELQPIGEITEPSAAAHLRDDLDFYLRAPADDRSSNIEFRLSWRGPRVSEKLALLHAILSAN